jgi:hypothetical protein
MEQLGLITAAGAPCFSNRASGGSSGTAKRKRETKKVLTPARKSRRLQSQPAEHSGLLVSQEDSSSHEHIQSHQAPTEKERMDKYQRLLRKHKENGVKIPERASYAHTVRRVVSMSRKQLVNRVKSIERAAGMYAVVKMRMFCEVLIMEAGTTDDEGDGKPLPLSNAKHAKMQFAGGGEGSTAEVDEGEAEGNEYAEVATLARAALERLLLLPRFSGQAHADVYDIVISQQSKAKCGRTAKKSR